MALQVFFLLVPSDAKIAPTISGIWSYTYFSMLFKEDRVL